MNSFRKSAVIGLLAAMAIAPVARAQDYHRQDYHHHHHADNDERVTRVIVAGLLGGAVGIVAQAVHENWQADQEERAARWFHYHHRPYGPAAAAYGVDDGSALALEEYYTATYAHDPARPPLVIVNRPLGETYPAGVVRARY